MTEQPPKDWTIFDVLAWATQDFRTRGFSSPRLDAELLLAHALSQDRVALVVRAKELVDHAVLERFRSAVKRRRLAEPVSYILGEREFFGRPFRVDKRVLIPRPDTEILVEVSLRRTSERSMSLRALDLCTGSGAVAITLARERPTSFFLGVDISADALSVARDNQLRLGAYNAAFAEGDLFEPKAVSLHAWDLVTANPPYISSEEFPRLPRDVRDYEPRLALLSEGDGLSFYRLIIVNARRHLARGGVLAVEVGAGQAPAVRDLFQLHGYVHIEVARDYGGHERVVSGSLLE